MLNEGGASGEVPAQASQAWVFPGFGKKVGQGDGGQCLGDLQAEPPPQSRGSHWVEADPPTNPGSREAEGKSLPGGWSLRAFHRRGAVCPGQRLEASRGLKNTLECAP